MWLIDRDTNGVGGRRIPLPPPLREALVRWYVGRGSRGDEEAGITLVQNARIGAKWIACDCLAAEDAPPILTPAFLSEAETYYLRRLTSTKRPEHREECPFFRDQVTHRITEIRSRETPADPPSGFFEVLRPAPEKLAQRPDEAASDDRTRHASVPRLARLLWRLIDAAGTNRIPPSQHEPEPASIKREFEALGRAAAKIEIAPGIQLGRAFWTHANALHSRRAYAMLRQLAKSWPSGHAPQGFLVLFSPHIRGHIVDVPGAEPIQVANRVQSPSVRGNLIKGPFLVMIVAGEYPEAHGYAPRRAYAQPIFSGHRFIPVDSEFERSVLRELFKARRQLDKAGVDLAIEKPIFDRLTSQGSCRPDFLLEARSRVTGEIKQLVVEAMGFSDEEYLASKTTTHPRMRLLGPLLTIQPSDVEGDRVCDQLASALDI